MPWRRQSSATGSPACCSFRIPMICSSLNRSSSSSVSSTTDPSFRARAGQGQGHMQYPPVSGPNISTRSPSADNVCQRSAPMAENIPPASRSRRAPRRSTRFQNAAFCAIGIPLSCAKCLWYWSVWLVPDVKGFVYVLEDCDRRRIARGRFATDIPAPNLDRMVQWTRPLMTSIAPSSRWTES